MSSRHSRCFSEVSRRIDEISSKIQSASSSSSGTENRIQEMVERIENIQEKMYDFEINKRNNLLFYGIKEDRRETPSELLSKVSLHLDDSPVLNSMFADQVRVARLLHCEERDHDQLGLQDVLRSGCWRLQVRQ